jgi:hypothetical protein
MIQSSVSAFRLITGLYNFLYEYSTKWERSSSIINSSDMRVCFFHGCFLLFGLLWLLKFAIDCFLNRSITPQDYQDMKGRVEKDLVLAKDRLTDLQQ